MSEKRKSVQRMLLLPVIAVLAISASLISAYACRQIVLAERRGANLLLDGITDKLLSQALTGQLSLEAGQYGIVLDDGLVLAKAEGILQSGDVSGEEWFEKAGSGNGYGWLELDGERYYAAYKNSGTLTAVSLMTRSEYDSLVTGRLPGLIIAAFLIALAAFAVLYAVIARSLRPVRSVALCLSEIADGNYNARLESGGTGEFAGIEASVDMITAKIAEIIGEKLQAETLARESETLRCELMDKVHRDALTGVYNRRYLDENLDRIIRSMARQGFMLGVLMIDVDYFKLYNDTCGHGMGDECLKAVADALERGVLRPDDFVVRFGGDEFAVVLLNTDLEGANVVAERIIDNVRELKIIHEKNIDSGIVTVSIGVTAGAAKLTQRGGDYISRADEALYSSKQHGRNRYTFLNM